MHQHLAEYDALRARTLCLHVIDFLAWVTPLAQDLGLRLCCHPDDSPFLVLGLPCVMSIETNCNAVQSEFDLSANGVTPNSGSLGAWADYDLPVMMQHLCPHVHFLHLRNVRRDSDTVPCSFIGSEHSAGSTDMVTAGLAEARRRRATNTADLDIPMQPDR